MSWTNFTPGPWIAFDEGRGVVQSNGGGIAFLLRSGAERQANATLIAAAPDLYVVLDKAADSFADLRTMFAMTGSVLGSAAVDAAERHCRAAIARARGES